MRRRFVEMLLGGGLFASIVAFVYPVVRYLVPPPVTDLGGDEVVAAKVGELKPNGCQDFPVRYPPGLLLMTAEGEYRALSATCTHLGCTVQYRNDLREIWCACHNGMYDLNGRKSPALRRVRWKSSRCTCAATRSVVSRKREA